MNLTPKSARAMYAELEPTRQLYLDRARKCAELTIPFLMPPPGMAGQSLPTPWQAMGAMGVNTLSNKMILALMPPNTPFFRLQMDDVTQRAVQQAGAGPDVEQALNSYELALMREIEEKADRVAGIEAMKQLINSGNVLVYLPPAGTMRVYKLDQYVVKRDRSGNILRAVIKEVISALAVPDNLKAIALKEAEEEGSADNSVDIYTCIERQSRDFYRVWQEVCDEQVPGSAGFVTADAMPYLALRWFRVDGEDYGRAFVEEYMGDLQSLEGLQKAVVEASAAAAKLLFLRNPSSSTTAEEFANSENGAVLDGLETDFKLLQADKFADMRAAMASIERLEQRLSKAFLMVSSIQRNAERVTAEEIRTMATDLEDSLGGVYSTLTLEFQLPYIKRKIALLQMQNKLPHFPKGSVKPSIVTGIAALGRNHEVTKIMQWAQACAALIGPEAFAQSIQTDALLKTIGAGFGVQTATIVKTAQQMQAEQQAQQQQQTMQTLGPEVIRANAARKSQ